MKLVKTFVPKERYLSPEFLALEYDRLWSRVWQIACREEELARVGDYVEYTIGDESIVVVRSAPDAIHAFPNVCLHRGTRLVTGTGHVDGTFRCPFHGWRYDLEGRVAEVVDAADFTELPSELCLRPIRTERWGGFVFVNLDEAAAPLAEYLDPLPDLLRPYHLEEMRFRSYLTTVLPANWKAVVDAFNEAYHVQTAHEQLLPWTDDVSIAYEQLGIHAHYGRLVGARRELRPSPRLSAGDVTWDEGAILAGLVSGLGGAFLRDERAIVEELRGAGLAPGTLLRAYQERRRDLLAARGLDVSGLELDQMTSAEDVYVFPNVVGPIYPGSAILFRVRPHGRDPDRSIKDTWVLEWPDPATGWTMPPRRSVPEWRDRDWGEITTQDYENLERVQLGMKSSGFDGLRLNPRQEANLLHMHATIDRYLFSPEDGPPSAAGRGAPSETSGPSADEGCRSAAQWVTDASKGHLMGLLDKAKETARKGADLAKKGVEAGQEKLEETKLKKRIGDLKEELGGVVFSQRHGGGDGASEAEIDRLVREIAAAEEELAKLAADDKEP